MTRRKRWTEVYGWLPDVNAVLLDTLITRHEIESVIEIGAFVGKSTVFFAERCERVYSVEPFHQDHEDYVTIKARRMRGGQHAAFLRNIAGYPNVELIEATSKEAFLGVRQHPYLSADLVYLDGSHQYEDVRHDLAAWLPRADRVLCGDDYSEWWPGVRRAVDERPEPINTNQRLWYLVK